MSTNYEACPICGQAHTSSACPTPTPPAGAEPSPEAKRPPEQVLGFLRSVILSGESWSKTCSKEYSDAVTGITALRAELERERADKERILKSAQNAHELKSEVEAELERVKGERDQAKRVLMEHAKGNVRFHGSAVGEDIVQFKVDAGNVLLKLEKDLTAARARIGELEGHHQRDEDMIVQRTKELAIYRKLLSEGQDIIHKYGSDIAELQQQLALANAKYEEARRAGVKCFDESHPDDLQARIHATIKQHERLWLNGGYIYLSSYLAKAIFEMLNQPLK